MTVRDSERATAILLAVMRGQRKQSVVRTKDEAELWDELVTQVQEIKEDGYEVAIPNP